MLTPQQFASLCDTYPGLPNGPSFSIGQPYEGQPRSVRINDGRSGLRDVMVHHPFGVLVLDDGSALFWVADVEQARKINGHDRSWDPENDADVGGLDIQIFSIPHILSLLHGTVELRISVTSGDPRTLPPRVRDHWIAKLQVVHLYELHRLSQVEDWELQGQERLRHWWHVLYARLHDEHRRLMIYWNPVTKASEKHELVRVELSSHMHAVRLVLAPTWDVQGNHLWFTTMNGQGQLDLHNLSFEYCEIP